MNITIKKVPAIAATSSVTNIRKECDNNGMSPDNTAQISHALSFIITSQHYIQFRHLKLCQPKFWFISRVSKCRCSWHVSGEGDPTRGSEQHHPWHCWHSLISDTEHWLNIDSPDPGCGALTLATRLHHQAPEVTSFSGGWSLGQDRDLSQSGETKS